VKEIIIFCQAPADVQYTLDIYDKNKHRAKVSIYCINVKASYKFLKSLNLVLNQLVFIPYSLEFSLNKPQTIYSEKKRLAKLYKKHFDTITGYDIYFFSHLYDWLLYSILGKLKFKNNILLIDHYRYTKSIYTKPILSIKALYYILLYKFVTDVYLVPNLHQNKLILSFPLARHKVIKAQLPGSLKRIWEKYKHEMNIEEKSVLLFESGTEDSSLVINYEQTYINILEQLREANIKIYIKPHPRLGYTNRFKQYAEIIPSYVPGEFLPVSKFRGVLGVGTAAISNLANLNSNVYSLLNCFSFKNKYIQKNIREYLIVRSNNSINFINDINEMALYNKQVVDK